MSQLFSLVTLLRFINQALHYLLFHCHFFIFLNFFVANRTRQRLLQWDKVSVLSSWMPGSRAPSSWKIITLSWIGYIWFTFGYRTVQFALPPS
jgi:hypothetical protein